jgi:putative membrane protein
MDKILKYLIHLGISGLAVMVTAYVLPGVHVNTYVTAILAALVLSVLNTFIKPLLILLTIPFTLLTLGLFLVFINACMIMLTDYFVEGFTVDSWWWALLFSIILSIATSLLEAPLATNKNNKRQENEEEIY